MGLLLTEIMVIASFTVKVRETVAATRDESQVSYCLLIGPLHRLANPDA